MTDVRIESRWQDSWETAGPELQATCAELSITVDGEPVTRVMDRTDKSVRDTVRVSVYPLAEWLAQHWWALWNEPLLSPSGIRPDYDARHSLASAREGYALPPLRIQPEGPAVRLSWAAEKLPYHRVDLAAPRGEHWADTEAV